MAGAEEATNIEVPSHETSLAIWDLPSPLVINRSSTMKVGAKCSSGCELTDYVIEICDEGRAAVVSARLGPVPWSGTSALYWAQVHLIAPSTEGTYCWTALLKENSDGPHREASSNFRFITVTPPEHTVTVRVVAKETQTAVDEVEVRIGFYRGRTDEIGSAKVDVPKGSFEVNVWKSGYEAFTSTIDVTHDVALRVELIAAPEPAQEYWK